MPVTEPEIPAVIIPESPDAELKLDIARAYLDLREPEAAAEILREVIVEGGSRQQQEAGEILSFIA
jgi:FimV-like protein